MAAHKDNLTPEQKTEIKTKCVRDNFFPQPSTANTTTTKRRTNTTTVDTLL